MTMLWYTPGPASVEMTRNIVEAGATGVRLTFSYSTREYQANLAANHREIADSLGSEFLVVADLAGEKFRLGRLVPKDSINVYRGQVFQLKANALEAREDDVLPVPNARFFENAVEDDLVTVGDGGATFSIHGIDCELGTATAIVCEAGTINSLRGLTIQGRLFQPQCLTSKDLDDLRFVAKADVFDAIALSFVSSAKDVEDARRVLERMGSSVAIVSKIETVAGVENAYEIAAHSDLVMVARGDLALSLPWVELPWAVNKIIEGAVAASTPWVMATQIVEGLERFVMPTRAEICDLAHWLSRGCNGVMTSYETAFGSSPVAAVRATRALIDRWSSEGLTVKP